MVRLWRLLTEPILPYGTPLFFGRVQRSFADKTVRISSQICLGTEFIKFRTPFSKDMLPVFFTLKKLGKYAKLLIHSAEKQGRPIR